MNILIIDDEPSFRDYLAAILTDVFKHRVTTAGSYNEAALLFDKESSVFDLAFIDMKMPLIDGFQTGLRLKQQFPHLVTVMLTAHPSVDKVIAALRDHRFEDFLIKEDLEDVQEFAPLKNALHRAENLAATRKALTDEYRLSDVLRTQYADVHSLFIGQSESYRQIREFIKKVAPSQVSVLITGETGAGKDLVAREIHRLSKRKLKPFIPINCSAIPSGLLESELFGHKKGAFTGAVGDRAGYFKLAEGGSLFLDEIGDMPLELQSKLLRVLEEKRFFPVGSGKLSDAVELDVRIISATNQDLKQKTDEGKFRRDLLYRLNTLVLAIPPLRDRPEDVEPLVNFFIAQKSDPDRIKGIRSDALDMLRQWSWPGNVRELQNVTERAILLSSGEYLQAKDFPAEMRLRFTPSAPRADDLKKQLSTSGHDESDLHADGRIPPESLNERHDRFWETFKSRDFKLWTFENAEEANRELTSIFRQARYLKNRRSGKLVVNRKQSLDLLLDFVCATTGNLERRHIRFEFSANSFSNNGSRANSSRDARHDSILIQPVLKGLPDTYIFNLLYPPIRKSDFTAQPPQRIVRAALLRYAFEVAPTTTLKSVFGRTMSFLTDDENSKLVEGLSHSGLDAVRAYLCGADNIFAGIARKLKTEPESILEEIRSVFPMSQFL